MAWMSSTPNHCDVFLFEDGIIPNWNFTDLLHSFMIVFRVLCGEWIECLWDCMLVSGWTCIPFFISAVVIGNLVVLNLFLTLLLSSFGASNLSQAPSDAADTKKLQEAIYRFIRGSNWVKRFLLQVVKSIRSRSTNNTADQTQKMMGKKPFEALTTGEFAADGQALSMETFSKGFTHVEVAIIDDLKLATNHDSKKDSFQTSGGELDSDKYADHVEDIIEAEYPTDCCPDCCYVRFPFLKGDDSSELWVRWNNLRKKSFILVKHKYFETFVITTIIFSSLALTAEDVNLKYRPWLQEALWYMDKIFTVLFLFEMLLKWLAFGFKKYFTNPWCWLDFVIVLLSTFNLVVELAGYDNIPVFKAIRTLRALRPLRAVSRLEGMRVVVNALVQAIPAISNVLFVCLIFWLIFAIMGVQLLSGKFYSCKDHKMNLLNASIVPDKLTCQQKNFTWSNQNINFDNVPNAYLALFQVATFKGWIAIMKAAVDSTGKDLQPESEAHIYIYIYFFFFIIIGSFFTLNLFIGVIIENFNKQKRKAGGSPEMFITEGQKKYCKAMKKICSRKPIKAIPRSHFKLQAVVFDLTTSKKFDKAIMIFICMNMAVMTLDHYEPSENFETILEHLNIFFIAIFTVECMLKLFALRLYYFKEMWNVFDFVVVTFSILDIILKDLIEKYFVSSTLLRMARVLKVGRALRLLKGARGTRTLLITLVMSLPALFNIGLLLFLVMFIYAIFGMFLFMKVRYRAGIDQNFNFETFGHSMILLFQMSTSAGSDGVLTAIMEENDCVMRDGDCGSRTLAVVYIVSYLIITFFIIVNMYIAVILENYSEALEDALEGLTEDDYDMYYEIWQNFDPEGTQFIRYSAVSTLLYTLKKPLQIPKPNKYKIISMDIPIYKNDLMFCADILTALTKDFFKRKGCHIDESVELEVVSMKSTVYNPISSTMKRQREIYAARIIQLAWRQYIANLNASVLCEK